MVSMITMRIRVIMEIECINSACIYEKIMKASGNGKREYLPL